MLHRLFLVIMLSVALGATAFTQTEVPVEADQFVDSVGVNVHLGYTNTLYYTDFPYIKGALSLLGARHLRDGDPAPPPEFYDRHSSLLTLGVHGEFLTSITDQAADIAALPSLFSAGYFEAYEPPNECDVSGACGSPWVSNLVDFLPVLKQNSQGYPIFGPSFANPQGPPMIGDVSSATDVGNMHNYKGGWNPGFTGSWGYDYTNYLSDALAIDLAGMTNPNQPVVSTETGYTNAVASESNQTGYPAGTLEPYDNNSVSEAIAGTYMPRVPLTAWQSGIARTYINELVSSPGLDYGLLRGDGTPKPGFMTLSNLLYLLSDPGPNFELIPLSYSIFGGDSTLQHLLLQKRDGSYYLILWLESSIFDKFSNTATPVVWQDVVITPSAATTNALKLRWINNGKIDLSTLPSGPFHVSVGPDITVLVFSVTTGNMSDERAGGSKASLQSHPMRSVCTTAQLSHVKWNRCYASTGPAIARGAFANKPLSR